MLVTLLLLTLNAPQEARIETYLRLLGQVESRAKRASVEQAFEAAEVLDAALLEASGEDGTYLESLTEAEFAELGRRLRGIGLNREEFVVAGPEPAFFLDLARRFGTSTDVRFFESLVATMPDGVWRSYMIQQTDVTGCIDFESDELIDRYEMWQTFRHKHPGAYRERVEAETTRIEEALTEWTCACGPREGVLRTLREFVRKQPHSEIRARVKERILDIEKGRSTIRFECSSDV